MTRQGKITTEARKNFESFKRVGYNESGNIG